MSVKSVPNMSENPSNTHSASGCHAMNLHILICIYDLVDNCWGLNRVVRRIRLYWILDLWVITILIACVMTQEHHLLSFQAPERRFYHASLMTWSFQSCIRVRAMSKFIHRCDKILGKQPILINLVYYAIRNIRCLFIGATLGGSRWMEDWQQCALIPWFHHLWDYCK